MVKHTRIPDDNVEKRCKYCDEWFATWGGLGTHHGKKHKGLPFEKYLGPKKSAKVVDSGIKDIL